MTISEDMVAVRLLIDRYSVAVTYKDEAEIAAVFADDGEWRVDAPFNMHVVGAKTIAAAICQSLGGLEFISQMVHSVVPAIQGDEGRVCSIMHEMARTSDRSGGMLMLGVYEDVVRRVGGQWLFKHRRFRPIYLDQNPPTGTAFPQLSRT
jgi:hypothetical protein